ncbi:MAG: type II toxin-antitoxin system HicA family toxin [Bacteroidota bacterium]
MEIEILITNIKRTHSPINLKDFNRIAEHFGFQLDHIKGSHFVYRNWTGKKFVIPVHNKKIKALYVRKFIKEQE